MYQVETGLSQIEPRDLHAPAQQRGQAQGGRDLVGADDRFGSERGIVVHHEVFQVETGAR